MSEESPEARPEVIDINNIPVTFADWFVAANENLGIVTLDLGAIDRSMVTERDGIAKVVVTARLRMGSDFAMRLSALLKDIVENAAKNVEETDGIVPIEGGDFDDILS
jgi:hypothetical protein